MAGKSFKEYISRKLEECDQLDEQFLKSTVEFKELDKLFENSLGDVLELSIFEVRGILVEAELSTLENKISQLESKGEVSNEIEILLLMDKCDKLITEKETKLSAFKSQLKSQNEEYQIKITPVLKELEDNFNKELQRKDKLFKNTTSFLAKASPIPAEKDVSTLLDELSRGILDLESRYCDFKASNTSDFFSVDVAFDIIRIEKQIKDKLDYVFNLISRLERQAVIDTINHDSKNIHLERLKQSLIDISSTINIRLNTSLPEEDRDLLNFYQKLADPKQIQSLKILLFSDLATKVNPQQALEYAIKSDNTLAADLIKNRFDIGDDDPDPTPGFKP